MGVFTHGILVFMIPSIPTPAELQELLLQHYGITPSEKEAFLSPSYSLGDTDGFEGMDVAVARIKKAVDTGEKIGIYADYDCDGIPGAVVLLDFLTALGVKENVEVYIPDRHMQGYGVSKVGIDELHAKGVTLIITVDVGITALAEVADAQSRGVDVIVTDHHTPLEMYPAGVAVIHPAHGTYKNKDLCGAAVAFMLVRAFLKEYRSEYGIAEGWEKWLLDLVGFATLSDMMPLVGENRVLVQYGMIVMRKTRRVGLRALFAHTKLDMARLTETDLTFTIAPRLNAASRMATPLLAFELLATTDTSRALELVKELDSINTERKTLVARIVKEAHAKLDERDLQEIVVIGDPTWRPAVLGLVANKLQEAYGKSFFVWGEGGDGILKGSCRMNPEHHAAKLFQTLPDDTLLHAGGHQAAGGFAVSKEQVHFLEERLNSACKVLPTEEVGTVEGKLHIPLPLASVTARHLSSVRQFAPFGIANEEPLFRFESVIIESVKRFGKNKEHIECTIRDTTGIATAFTFFPETSLCEKCVVGAQITCIASFESGFRGGVRLHIQEIQ